MQMHLGLNTSVAEKPHVIASTDWVLQFLQFSLQRVGESVYALHDSVQAILMTLSGPAKPTMTPHGCYWCFCLCEEGRHGTVRMQRHTQDAAQL